MTDVDPDVVWAKLVGYPWWPARTAKARLPGEKVRVDFLGTGDHAELVNDDGHIQPFDADADADDRFKFSTKRQNVGGGAGGLKLQREFQDAVYEAKGLLGSLARASRLDQTTSSVPAAASAAASSSAAAAADESSGAAASESSELEVVRNIVPYEHDVPGSDITADCNELGPGWRVNTHTTKGGRAIKTFISPDGTRFRSYVKAMEHINGGPYDGGPRKALPPMIAEDAESVAVLKAVEDIKTAARRQLQANPGHPEQLAYDVPGYEHWHIQCRMRRDGSNTDIAILPPAAPRSSSCRACTDEPIRSVAHLIELLEIRFEARSRGSVPFQPPAVNELVQVEVADEHVAVRGQPEWRTGHVVRVMHSRFEVCVHKPSTDGSHVPEHNPG